MQPILMLAVVGVAAVALGTGFLNNNIELWIQEFGVGSGDIETPVEHVTVDFNIVQLPQPGTSFYKNHINECEFTLTEVVGDPTNLDKTSSMTCKLTGKDSETWLPNGKIITEGTLCAPSFGIGTHVIPLGVNTGCPTDFPAIVDGTPRSVDAMKVGDVIVVVHANTYSAGDHTCEPPLVLDRDTNECVTPDT